MVNQQRVVQQTIVDEMRLLCGDYNIDPSISIRESSRIVTGSADPTSIRGSPHALVQVSPKMAERWYRCWRDFGCLQMDLPPKPRVVGRLAIWTKHMQDSLAAILAEVPVLYLCEMSDLLYEHTNQRMTCKQISYCLYSRSLLNYSRKQVYEKATQAIESEKQRYIRTTRTYQAFWNGYIH
jgi:hypothetical protein